MSEAVKTQHDVLDSMSQFLATSVETVGIENTVNTLDFLTNKIKESPEVYQKLLTPETINGITTLIESTKGKDLNITTIMTAYSQIKKIFA